MWEEFCGEEWQQLKNIIIWGAGRHGYRAYEKLSKDFNIVAVIDNSTDKQGSTFGKHIIISPDEAKQYMADNKIIVTMAEYYYKSVKKQLTSMGLKENIEFIDYHTFATVWYYKYRNQINLMKTDISITRKCTLNCENCVQLLPYWKTSRKDDSFDSIKGDIESYFKYVDYVFEMNIVGGEPFLYKGLEEIIKYIGENYRNRIGYIGFITNGTIVPSDEVLNLMRKYEFGISLSDYSNDIDYKHHIPELIEKLEEFGINYMRNQGIDWFDFGFPRKRFNYSREDCARHMQECNTLCHILYDRKLYYCSFQWAAQMAGLFPSEDKAYCDLSENGINIDVEERIINLAMGNIEDGYLELCRFCGGWGNDNNCQVKTAKQFDYKYS